MVNDPESYEALEAEYLRVQQELDGAREELLRDSEEMQRLIEALAANRADVKWAHEFIAKVADTAYPKGYSGGHTHEEILGRVEKVAKWLEEWQAEGARLSEKLRDAERENERFRENLRQERIEHAAKHERLEHAEQRLAGLEQMIERKNAALARPCIQCGYEPKIVTPATPPPVAPSGGAA